MGVEKGNLIETAREVATRVLGGKPDLSHAQGTIVGNSVCFEVPAMKGLNGVIIIETEDLPGRQVRLSEPGDLPVEGVST